MTILTSPCLGSMAATLVGAAALPLAAYLIGSIPFGYLVGRMRGIDIRRHGSRNIGSTNVSRVLGRPWGLTVFVLDVLKGLAPAAVAGAYLHHAAQWQTVSGSAVYGVWLLTAFAAIAGHIWPVWLGFKGGKGVATSLGVVLGVYPYFTWPGLIALATWIVVTLASRYVSLGSIVAAVVFPIALVGISLPRGSGELHRIWPLVVFGMVMPLLVIWRHRGNIRRLLAGTESKIGQHKQVRVEPQSDSRGSAERL